jgi:hypothetical protein
MENDQLNDVLETKIATVFGEYHIHKLETWHFRQ